jgi:ankyrin repeat protein
MFINNHYNTNKYKMEAIMDFIIRGALISLIAIIAGLYSTTSSAEIHQAVIRGDSLSVKALVDESPQLLNARDENGKTPLSLAVEKGNIDIAQFLIKRGADVNLADMENKSPLHIAAAKGDPEIVMLLLEQEAVDIDDRSRIQRDGFEGGWTPLHMACLEGHPEIVRLLLEHGADREAKDGIQRTPLILAAEGRSLPVAQVLIEHGADINATAIRGYTALLYGARLQFEDYVDLLIENETKISEEDLIRAFQMAVISGMEGLYDYALKLGINVEEIRQADPGLIFPAAGGGSLAIVKSLVEYGFDPAQQDRNGFTPLHYAAIGGHNDVIRHFIDLGIDIDTRNKRGESAFNLASAKGLSETADYLKSIGANTGPPQFPLLQGPYMGQEPPGDIPEMFLPGIVSSQDRAHSSITFSPDGLEAYWTEMIPPGGRVAFMQVVDNRWTYPVAAAVDRDPTFSPDGKRLFFIKTRPLREGEKPGGDVNLKEEYWYMEKTDSGWSEPVSVGDKVNAIGVHWPCSLDREGNLYFSEFSDNMYCSRFVNGLYEEPIPLTKYFENPKLIGHNPFISLKGDYLLFSANESLHISFKRKDGTWTDPIRLNDTINASHTNGTPRVTADGKYMFFVSAGQGRPWGIYWVSTDFIDRLREEHLKG